MESTRHRSMMMVMTFQSTSTRPTTRHSYLPLGTRTAVFHGYSTTKFPVANASWMIYTKIFHLEGSVFYSTHAASNNLFRCYACILNPPPLNDLYNQSSRNIHLQHCLEFILHVNCIYQYGYGSPPGEGWGHPPLELCMSFWDRL